MINGRIEHCSELIIRSKGMYFTPSMLPMDTRKTRNCANKGTVVTGEWDCSSADKNRLVIHLNGLNHGVPHIEQGQGSEAHDVEPIPHAPITGMNQLSDRHDDGGQGENAGVCLNEHSSNEGIAALSQVPHHPCLPHY